MPAANDANEDGLDDATAKAIQDLIDEAKAAEEAANKALEDAKGEDGLITPTEQQAIEKANQAVADAKDKAQQEINKLDPSKGKETLQGNLDAVNGVEVPAVNDKNSDGLDDATAETIQGLIDEAAAAEQAAKDALDKANADGLITPTEQEALNKANQAVQDAKDTAQQAIDALDPSAGKDTLQGNLDAVNGVDVPAANDANEDGLDDATAKAIQDLIDEAKAAEEAANKALEDAKGEDGLITPTEQQAIEKANQAVADAKDKAQQEINKLDPSKGKETLQGNLDAVNGVEVPAVNDKNSDGLDDATAETIQGLIDEAAAAEQAAKDALDKANADGLITPTEQEALNKANQAVQDAKDTAQQAIDALDPSAGKDTLQGNLDAVNGVDVPAANDANEDGLDDATAKAIQDLINEAKAAEEAAKDALDKANADGLITPTEQEALNKANQAVQDAKDTAQQAIDALDPSAGKDTLQGNLDAVNGVDVPAANDANEDGLDDATAKAIQDLINEAKAAEEAANKALEDAKGEDGLITPTEQQAIEKRN
ncbi:GA-like domain-containing protein [Psychrobacter lutiphocae]|uniref:GA-like domain-containing protein n=1 Tax=Psychrobacter lutiphocae TaxID=540500 RepID=UPI0019180E69|nr:hypothetical protein [Psychrobacter lutiphocae]